MGFDGYSDTNPRTDRNERQGLMSQSKERSEGTFSSMFQGSWKSSASTRQSRKDAGEGDGTTAGDDMGDTSISSDWQGFATDGLGSFSDAVASPPKYLLQDLLVLVACFGLIAVMVFGARATDTGLEKAAGRPIVRNMFTAAFCFFVADLIAQIIQHESNVRQAMTELRWGRAFRAGLLGVFVNGVGYSV